MSSDDAPEAVLRDMMMEGLGQFKQMAVTIGQMADVDEDDASWIADKFKDDMLKAFHELVDANMEAIKAAMKKQLAGNGSKDKIKKQFGDVIPQVRKRPTSALEPEERSQKASRRTLLPGHPRPAARPASARGYTARLRPARSNEAIVILDDEEDGGDGASVEALAPRESRSRRTSSQAINYNIVEYYDERGVPHI